MPTFLVMCSVIQVETVLLSSVRLAMYSISTSSSLLSPETASTVLVVPFSFFGVSDSTGCFVPKLKLVIVFVEGVATEPASEAAGLIPKLKLFVEEGAVASVAAGLLKLKLLKAPEEGVDAAPNPAKPENTFGFPLN